MTLFLVGALGLVGVICRYYMGIFIPAYQGISLAVLSVNILGSCVGGIFLSSPLIAQRVSAGVTTAIAVGLLGGLTTFSSLSVDTVRLWQAGAINLAIINLLLNNFTGILACFLGFKLGSRIV